MSTQPRCPYCLDLLLPKEERVRCASCGTPHHAECFQANEGCVSFGCLSEDEVASGMSIFVRQEIKLGPPDRTALPLGPFTLSYRRLRVPPDRLTAAPSARLVLETLEVREGGRVGGRAVLSCSQPITFRRLELVLYQGIGSPRRVARASLIPSPKGLLTQQTLPAGTHPFELELLAPPRTPLVDPFQLELRLVQGVFADVRSSPAALYLLQARDDDAPAAQGPAPLPIVVRPHSAPPEDPGLEAPDAWTDLPVHRAGSLYDSGELTDRMIRARFCARPAAGEQLELKVSGPPQPPTLTLLIEGGAALSMLNLAVHYELIDDDGEELAAEPSIIEELFLLGHGCLDPLRFDRFTGLEVAFSVAPERLERLEEVRAHGRSAALRLRLALDAIDVSGRVVPTRTTAVPLTG